MTARRRIRTRIIAAALVVGATLSFTGIAGGATGTVGLGTVGSFAVIAGATVTNTGATAVSGDLGVSPGAAVVGFPPGQVANGTIHAADAVALQAQSDLTTAYNDAAGRASNGLLPADIGGLTLVPGVYTRAVALGLTNAVTLDAQGDPSAVWIFQIGTTLITASNASVNLINGAQACNVFWQVGSSATLGTDTVFKGTIMALTSISAQTRTDVQGRLLARNGAVTLDTNVVNRPACATSQPFVVPTIPTATTTPTTTATTTPTTTTAVAPATSTTVAGPTSSSTTSTPGPATTTTGPAAATTTTVAPAALAPVVTAPPAVTPAPTPTPSASPAPIAAPVASTAPAPGFPDTATSGAFQGSLPRTGDGTSTQLVVGLGAIALGGLLRVGSRGRCLRR